MHAFLRHVFVLILLNGGFAQKMADSTDEDTARFLRSQQI